MSLCNSVYTQESSSLNQKFQPFSVMEDLQRSLSLSVPHSSLFHLHPLSIDSELWLTAEQRTQEILCTIEPVLASEQKRWEVIDYIQRLIQGHFATEVYSFGSVPLKTYLPDGDIDLTALTYQNMEEDLARDVYNILKFAEQDPEFQVKDVQYIQAQVKIVKCSIKNMTVDISFNQMAGLCALYFLEKVDQFAGRDHLLKRSIILIKAWCFYESRILGASYGLLSTYALDIMILHIINLFHSSLPGPLAVLWRFLDYYSTFDWENYCIGINGPVAISSLPEIVAGSPESANNDLLLSQEFLQNCSKLFSIPIKALKNVGLGFPVKHLNILDPLKEDNNLGRSVSRANFHRIRFALSYGAKKLREILVLPAESMGAAFDLFFVNTLSRNGRGERPDALFPVPAFGIGRCEVYDLCIDIDYGNYSSCLLHGQWYPNYTLPVSLWPSTSVPSQIQQNGPMDVLFELTDWRQYAFPPGAVDVFAPGRLLCQLYTWPLYPSCSGFDQIGMSRGTGTYIPNVNQYPYRRKLTRKWVRKSRPRTHSQSLMSTQEVGQVEDALQTQKTGNDSCLDFSTGQVAPEAEKSDNGNSLDLSLEQFPPLPHSKKPMPSEVQSRDQPIGNAPMDKDRSAVLDGIHFETSGHSSLPSELPSSVAGKENSEGSTSIKTALVASKPFMHVQQASMENDDQMFPGQQSRLKYDKDFPPLCKLSVPGGGVIPRTDRMKGKGKQNM